MLKKTLGAAAAALLGVTMMASGAVAQDATPAGDCAATTPEENVQIIEQYFDAVLAGDTETADSLLHDDFEHNLSIEGAEVPNESGNQDELENLEHAADVNHEVTHTVAQNDWVAVYYTMEISGEHVEGADPEVTAETSAMVMSRIECGMIAESHFEFDSLGMLLQLGFEIHPPGE